MCVDRCLTVNVRPVHVSDVVKLVSVHLWIKRDKSLVYLGDRSPP